MPLTSGRISFEGDPGLAHALLPKAKQEVFRLQQRLSSLRLDRGFVQKALGPGALAYASVWPGAFSLHIVAYPQAPGWALVVPYVRKSYPDFLSGVILDPAIVKDPDSGEERVTAFHPTQPCATLHGLDFQEQENHRLAVYVAGHLFPELDSTNSNALALYSQHVLLKPTMYSGSMRRIVQVLMGFGFQGATSVYGVRVLSDSPIEIDEDEEDEGEVEIEQSKRIPTGYERTVASNGLQILYDYRFWRTHGLTLASDGRWWLVEVSQLNGVIAMPLPIFQDTDDEHLLAKMQDLNDSAGLSVRSDFGGFPSGEPFPSTEKGLAAAMRSGRVIRLAPPETLAEFYEKSMYSSAMGWAFNTGGTEAHNTCWYYHDDHIQRGCHYEVHLSIGATGEIVTYNEGLEFLVAMFEPLRSDAEFSEVFEPNMWKINRLTTAQAKELEKVGATIGVKTAFKQLDDMTLSPLATGVANLVQRAEGKIWWPTENQPQIKFAEPLLGYLQSHDMRPDQELDYEEVAKPKCNTTMHVFFAGNKFKYARFFYDPTVIENDFTDGATNDQIQHQPSGTLERITYKAPVAYPPMFYTDDFDDRVMKGPRTIYDLWERTNEGRYEVLASGYGLGDRIMEPGLFAYMVEANWPSNPQDQLIWANDKFWWEHYRKSTVQADPITSIAVPFFDREAMYYTHFERHSQIQENWDNHYYPMTSPQLGRLVATYNNELAQWETKVVDASDIDIDRLPSSLEWYGRYMSHASVYTPPVGGIVAIDGVAVDYVTTEAIDLTIYDFQDAATTYTDDKLDVWLVSSSNLTPFVTYTEARTDDPLWTPVWHLSSPDQVPQLLHSTQNAMGLADAINYQPNVNTPGYAVLGKPHYEKMEEKICTFVGVVE